MSGQDETRYDYWKRMEFTRSQWEKLSNHAREKGLIFLSSAFSVEAVELLDDLDMPAWKVGSGEFKSRELLDAMIKTGKPILYSSGMSTYKEISEAVKMFNERECPFGLFQCTSHYPTKLENVGLNVINEYKKAHNCPVGLSDHSGTLYPSLAAMAQGSDMIEIHVTFDKNMYGPDAVASVNFNELEELCKARDAFFTMDQNPVDKNIMAEKMSTMRGLFTKSLALKQPQKAGTVLLADMITVKKPGSGITSDKIDMVIGRKLKQDVSEDRLLRWEDIEDAA
ncbi:MAG: N-acetylneuraminate synthase [Alphaproteobacteria bacterium]|nr:N-acetylneuraminate synthase [Alphaproteobacteria bacterium]